MDKIDKDFFLKMGLTKNQMNIKYGKELTNKILKNKCLEHATIMINLENKKVYYFTDIEYALKDLKGIKVNYFD